MSLSKDMVSSVKKRLDLEEFTKDRVRYAKKTLKMLTRFSFIRFIGAVGGAPLGRIAKDEKIKLVLVVERETSFLTKFVLTNYLKFKFATKNFEIERITEIDDLKWNSTDAESGIKLLNLLSFLNRDKAYENLMAANNWIFEIFSNYPLEKVSWGFRVSKDLEKKVPKIYIRLNSLLAKKKN